MADIVVHQFVDRSLIAGKLKQKQAIKAKPTSTQGAEKLGGLIRYLVARVAEGKEKAGLVRWGPLEFFVVARVPDDPNPNFGVLLFV